MRHAKQSSEDILTRVLLFMWRMPRDSQCSQVRSHTRCCPDIRSGEHVDELWYAEDDRIAPAKVKGALEGEAREALWAEHRAFMVKYKDEATEQTSEDKEEKKE